MILAIVFRIDRSGARVIQAREMVVAWTTVVGKGDGVREMGRRGGIAVGFGGVADRIC